MENKTVEENNDIQIDLIIADWMDREATGNSQVYMAELNMIRGAIKEYASLQCAEMKKELEIVNGCRTSAKSCLPMIVGKYDQLTERSELSLEQKLTQLVYNTIVDAAYKEEEHETTTTKIINIITTFNQCAEMKEELESWKKEHFETVEMAAANIKEMKDENEKLKQALEFHKNESGFFKSDAQLQSNSAHKIWQIKLDLEAENKQLQEEVERLKCVLKESKDTILYLVSEYANGTSMAAEETLTSINRTLR